MASISVRTPKVIPNKFDYETTFSIKKSGALFHREWERQSGEYYIQEKYSFEHKTNKFLFKDSYLFDTATKMNYNMVTTQYLLKKGISAGFALYHIHQIPSERLVVEYRIIDKDFNFILLNGKAVSNISINSNLKTFNYNINAEIKFGLLRNLDVYFLFNNEVLDGLTLFQVKSGIEINLPQ